jgi:transcriptional antiterminator RfaH
MQNPTEYLATSDQVKHFAVVNTHPHREPTVIEHLARQGYVGYYPKLLQRVSHARQVKDVLRPMFPGYLFVALDATQRWSPIASTVGVRRVVQFGPRPATLDATFIAALKAREIDGSIIRPTNPYSVGDSVRLVGNAFEGVIAQIVELKAQERIIVLFDLLQRTVKLNTEPKFVRPETG